MLTSQRFRRLICVTTVFYAGACHAYIDPGTGAYLTQVLIALFGAVLFYAGYPIRWLKSVLKSRREKRCEAAEQDKS